MTREEKDRMHMVWEKGLLKLMQRLKEGPEAIDKSSNKYIVRFFGFLLLWKIVMTTITHLWKQMGPGGARSDGGSSSSSRSSRIIYLQ